MNPRSVLTAMGIAFALGCTPADSKGNAAPAPAASCTKFGESCTFSPGKLGTCVQKDDCTGNACLVCQSQH